jgi:uncharacterized protein YutE (UPF0331/DUF86 family)
MTPQKVSKQVVLDRLDWVQQMIAQIESLPLSDAGSFFADNRNVWTAESCLRRGLEALLDTGRHILAKGFGMGVTEYKEIAGQLGEVGVLEEDEAEMLRILAGYRNRMVHFYHEISAEELFEICSTQLSDLDRLAAAFRDWLVDNPDRVDEAL